MLETYLKEMNKTPLQAGRIRAVLGQVFNFDELGVMTLEQAIDEWTQGPECEIDCYSTWSKKRNGDRHLLKPKWGISVKKKSGYMGGPSIPKLAAEYANWLMGDRFDLDSMEKKANEAYSS